MEEGSGHLGPHPGIKAYGLIVGLLISRLLSLGTFRCHAVCQVDLEGGHSLCLHLHRLPFCIHFAACGKHTCR